MTPREHRLKTQEIRLRERELAVRHWQARESASARIVDGGFRSLLIVNGVGLLALGAFLAMAIPVGEAQDLVPFIVMAIALHAIGLMFAVSLSWTRYMARHFEDRRGVRGARNPWWWATTIFSVASALFFVAGVGFVVYGGMTHLGDIDDDSPPSQVTHA